MEITEKRAMTDLLGCLKSRLKWYQEAAEVKSGKKPLETGKEYPPQSIKYCEGAAAELKNTIDMVEHYIKTLQLTEIKAMTKFEVGKNYATRSACNGFEIFGKNPEKSTA